MSKTALIVGGGPAGAGAALALLGGGFDVELFERRPDFSPRVCGTFLDGEALRHLDALGLGERVRAESVAVPRVVATFPPDRSRFVGLPEAGAALPRPRLEAILLDEVRRRGGRVSMGVRVSPGDGARTVGLEGAGVGADHVRTRHADLVLWADGRFSTGPSTGGPGHYGWNAEFDGVAQRPGDLSLHFAARGYVGVVTHRDGTSNICGLYRRENEPLDWETVYQHLRDTAPAFARLTARALRRSPWRGVGPLPFSRGLRPRDDIFRVGDAGAVGDPFMGEGIGRALATGPLLRAALSAVDDRPLLERYRALWKASYGGRFAFGAWARRLLLNHRPSPLLLRLLFSPAVLPRLLSLFHRGYRPPSEIHGRLV